jgi:hypothetical protein
VIGQDYPDVYVPPPDGHFEDEGPVFRRSWQPVDLTQVLEGGWEPPVPTVGRRADGVGLFYPGKGHTVSSESEAGKTWFMLSVVLDEIAAGNAVVYVDFEDDEGGVVGRLLTLGANRLDLAARFHYVRPDDALGGGVHLDDLTSLLREARPTLGVIDGVTEALTLHGLSPNDNSDVAKFGRMLPRRIAASGAAAVSLDHVTKSNETRGRYSIGAVHKLNGLDGAAYVLENRSSFGVGLTGRSTLRIAKDRPGQLRKHALSSSAGMHWMGDLVLVSHQEGFAEVSIEAPATQAEEFRPTLYMGRIMAVIEDKGPLSKRLIRAAVKGKSATIDTALDALILDGFLTESSPHNKVKDWSEGGGRMMPTRDPVTHRDPGVTGSTRDPVTPPIQGGHVGSTPTTTQQVTRDLERAPSPSQRLSTALTDLADAGLTTPCTPYPDAFTSDEPAERKAAANWCVACPVLDLCREAGRSERFHVWGGVDRAPRSRPKASEVMSR